MALTNTIRHKMVHGAPAHLKRFVLVLFLVQHLRVGDTATQLNELNVMDLILPQGNKGQVAASNLRNKVMVVIMMGSTDKTAFMGLARWLSG